MATEGAEHTEPSYVRPGSILLVCGYVFVLTSAASISVMLWMIATRGWGLDPSTQPDQQLRDLVALHIPMGMALVLCIVSALFARSLFQLAGKSTVNVIPDADRQLLGPLVQSANKDGIDQYVRLSSLTGFTGTFTKLELYGLPLATIFLTIVFSLLYFADKAFLDLAKLTLGAFIGSFVQRKAEQDKASKPAPTGA